MAGIRVLLIGGPAGRTATDRIHEVSSTAEPVKLATGGGYEHFRYSGETRELDGAVLPVFRWCERTRVAE